MLSSLLMFLIAGLGNAIAAPTFVTDPSSAGFLIKPEGNEYGVRARATTLAAAFFYAHAHAHPPCSQCLTVASSSSGIRNGDAVYLMQCARDFPSGVQGWEIARGAGKIKLKNTDWCLDAGINPSNGVRMKVWRCENVPQQNWYFTDDNRCVRFLLPLSDLHCPS